MNRLSCFIIVLFFVLFVPFSSGNLLSNGNFESTTDYNIHICCNSTLSGCYDNTYLIYSPLDWYIQRENQGRLINPNTTIELFFANQTKGSYSQAIFSQKASSCGYNESCGYVNSTLGNFIEQDINNISNTSLVFSFNIRGCYPSDGLRQKCNSEFFDIIQEDSYYGSENYKTNYRYTLELDSDSGTYNYTDNSYIGNALILGWHHFEIDISEASPINHSIENFNATLRFENDISDSSDGSFYCFVLDNIDLDYKENATPPYEDASTALTYIEDMHDFYGTISSYNLEWGQDSSCDGGSASSISDITLSAYDFSTSKGFAEVPYGQLHYFPSCDGCSSYQELEYVVDCSSLDGLGKTGRNNKRPYVVIYYDDGSSLDVSDQTLLYPDYYDSNPNKCPSGNDKAPMNIRIPLYDYNSIDYIHYNITQRFVYEPNHALSECAWTSINVTPDTENIIPTRQIYEDPMEDSYHTITGHNNIFPLFALNGDSEGENITFDLWSFSSYEESSMNNNVQIWLYDSDESVKSVTTETATIDNEKLFNIYDNYGGARWVRNVTDATEFSVSLSDLNSYSYELIEPDYGDIVDVKVFSDPEEHSDKSDNATTRWSVGDELGVGFCEDVCVGDTFYDYELDENDACILMSKTPYSPLCVDEVTTTIEQEGGLFSTGNATANLFGFEPEVGNFLLAIILSAVFGLFFTSLFAKNISQKGENTFIIFLVFFFVFIMLFTLAGMVPSWITIILIILTTFAIASFFRKGITGG